MEPTLVKAGLPPPPLAAAALTGVGSIDSSRRQDFDGQERASRGPPTHSKKREPRTFPLDKKVPIQGAASVGFAAGNPGNAGSPAPGSQHGFGPLFNRLLRGEVREGPGDWPRPPDAMRHSVA